MEVSTGDKVIHQTGEEFTVVAASPDNPMVVCKDKWGESTTLHKDQLTVKRYLHHG